MKALILSNHYKDHPSLNAMADCFRENNSAKFHLKNLVGAQTALIASHSIQKIRRPQLFIFNDNAITYCCWDICYIFLAWK